MVDMQNKSQVNCYKLFALQEFSISFWLFFRYSHCPFCLFEETGIVVGK